MPDCKKYGGITRAELAQLRGYLKTEGVTVPEGDDVPIKAPFGVELRAIYSEDQKTLEVCITKKPFYIPESQIWKLIDAGAAEYGK